MTNQTAFPVMTLLIKKGIKNYASIYLELRKMYLRNYNSVINLYKLESDFSSWVVALPEEELKSLIVLIELGR